MASNQAIARLKKEFIRLQKEPVPHIEAVPLESNILEWHYVIEGPSDTPYAGGYYHGKIKFPPEYPYKPPSIMMITPSGRFKPNTRLCLSMSDFHPETWNPLWSVSSILSGLLSFMLESTPTVGSVETSDYAKRDLATKSLAFNLKDVTFCKLFPHHQQTFERLQAQRQASTDTKTMGADNLGVAGSGASSHRLKTDFRTNVSTQDLLVVMIVIISIIFGVSFLYR